MKSYAIVLSALLLAGCGSTVTDEQQSANDVEEAVTTEDETTTEQQTTEDVTDEAIDEPIVEQGEEASDEPVDNPDESVSNANVSDDDLLMWFYKMEDWSGYSSILSMEDQYADESMNTLFQQETTYRHPDALYTVTQFAGVSMSLLEKYYIDNTLYERVDLGEWEEISNEAPANPLAPRITFFESLLTVADRQVEHLGQEQYRITFHVRDEHLVEVYTAMHNVFGTSNDYVNEPMSSIVIDMHYDDRFMQSFSMTTQFAEPNEDVPESQAIHEQFTDINGIEDMPALDAL